MLNKSTQQFTFNLQAFIFVFRSSPKKFIDFSYFEKIQASHWVKTISIPAFLVFFWIHCVIFSFFKFNKSHIKHIISLIGATSCTLAIFLLTFVSKTLGTVFLRISFRRFWIERLPSRSNYCSISQQFFSSLDCWQLLLHIAIIHLQSVYTSRGSLYCLHNL